MSEFQYTNYYYNTHFTYDMDDTIHITTPNYPDLIYTVSTNTYSLVDGTVISPEMNSYYDNEVEVILYRAKYQNDEE